VLGDERRACPRLRYSTCDRGSAGQPSERAGVGLISSRGRGQTPADNGKIPPSRGLSASSPPSLSIRLGRCAAASEWITVAGHSEAVVQVWQVKRVAVCLAAGRSAGESAARGRERAYVARAGRHQ
jgi:hypothetical protein